VAARNAQSVRLDFFLRLGLRFYARLGGGEGRGHGGGQASGVHMATGRDLNMAVAQKYIVTVDGDKQEQIQGLRQSVVKVSQWLQTPRLSWSGKGSPGAGAARLGRTDGPTDDQPCAWFQPVPNDAGTFTSASAQALELSGCQIT